MTDHAVQRCGATVFGTGRCMAYPVKGYDRCRHHLNVEATRVTPMTDHAERTAVLSGLDELARGLDYGQARTIREYIVALVAERDDYRRMVDDLQRDDERVQARVTELEAANDIAAQEIASAMTSLSTGPAKDGYAYSCLANAAAALAKEGT